MKQFKHFTPNDFVKTHNNKRIVIISCGATKRKEPSKAKDLYQGQYFKLIYKLAKLYRPDFLYIIGVYVGIITVNTYLKPYDLPIDKINKDELHELHRKIISKLTDCHDLTKDEFILLANQKHIEGILPHLKNYKRPLQGVGIGYAIGLMTRYFQKYKSINDEGVNDV
jgi:hypothetical protein